MEQKCFTRYYKTPHLTEERTKELLQQLKLVIPDLIGVETESVFYVESNRQLRKAEGERLRWLLRDKGQDKNLAQKPFLGRGDNVIDVAPLLHVETSDSSNGTNGCHSSEISPITRVEKGRRFKLKLDRQLTIQERQMIDPLLHDKMREGIYKEPLTSFVTDKVPAPIEYIDILGRGMEAINEACAKYGTPLDAIDKSFILHMFTNLSKCNPTDAEWVDFGNSFSEHSRHPVFGAKLIIDGEVKPFTLFDLVKATLTNKSNSVIAFHDNASAITGYPVSVLVAERAGFPSAERMATILYHYVLTCETHNHPCLWAALPGAATGGGGRRRDNQAVGRGGILGGASAGFVGGNLYINGYDLPWEDPNFRYDPLTESPLSFFINATKGAFGDGNEFGEPVTITFAESFGLIVGKERWEFIKPIMFAGGFSFLHSELIKKEIPQKGWIIVRLGGKAYRIGLGGGAASSMIAGENTAALDLDSVQRADGEMARKTDCVLSIFAKMGAKSPIKAIHDQGAGGIMNVFKEILEGVGGKLFLRKITLGDQTMSTVEILVSEYQENVIFLIAPEDWDFVKGVADREKCPCDAVGVITGDGRAVVVDEKDGTTPIDFNLAHIFGEYPQKTFEDKTRDLNIPPLRIPPGFNLKQGLQLVPKLLGVTSREWMADRVDSCVSGKVVQSQRCGAEGLPVNPYSIVAPGIFDNVGNLTSCGLRPAIGLPDPAAMSRMVAAEVFGKLLFAPVSAPDEIKVSANWMLAAKLEGGLAWLYTAAESLRNIMNALGMDVDGGKDSLSLAAKVPGEDGNLVIVRSPGTLVLSTYAACPDTTKAITADIKLPGRSRLAFLDLAHGMTRLGGSALAQVLKQVGTVCPDVEHPESMVSTRKVMSQLLDEQLMLAGQFRTRGGLIQALNDMAFAGNCGYDVSLQHSKANEAEMFFNEEVGLVFEYLPENEEAIKTHFDNSGLGNLLHFIGSTSLEKRICVSFNGRQVLDESMFKLRAEWRETSFQMKEQSAVKSVVQEERLVCYSRIGPQYRLTFDPDRFAPVVINYPGKPKVAIICDEGTNSFEEAISAFFLAGFEPYRVHLTDLAAGRISLKEFQVIYFAGGFSYKDVFGSAKCMAGFIKFNKRVSQEFIDFYARPDTYSLGDCNGCQLMMLLFEMIFFSAAEEDQPNLIVNRSEVFEDRIPSARILESSCVWLEGMEGSVLPIRGDHGEGRFVFSNKKVYERIIAENLAPIRFVDDHGASTEVYPLNPNGSKDGITAICDPSGRHLAFMLHPERQIVKKQLVWTPQEWNHIQNSPWLRMLQNVRTKVQKN